MDLDRLHRGLTTRLVARTIFSFSSVGSTNDVARAMAERGAAEGTVVAADFQTAGRGRYGRVWLSDPGDSLMTSTILRPSIPAADVFYLTIVPALAVYDTVLCVGIPDVGLKWPNDVQVRGKKIAGILTELSVSGAKLDYAVVGIGLNVNLDADRHSEIASQATSLAAELGRQLDLVLVAQRLFRAIDDRYSALVGGRAPDLFAAWRSALTTIGQSVEIIEAPGRRTDPAFVEDVTPDGGLVILCDGARRVVYSGEVTFSTAPS